jgi:hypothetical protein
LATNLEGGPVAIKDVGAHDLRSGAVGAVSVKRARVGIVHEVILALVRLLGEPVERDLPHVERHKVRRGRVDDKGEGSAAITSTERLVLGGQGALVVVVRGVVGEGVGVAAQRVVAACSWDAVGVGAKQALAVVGRARHVVGVSFRRGVGWAREPREARAVRIRRALNVVGRAVAVGAVPLASRLWAHFGASSFVVLCLGVVNVQVLAVALSGGARAVFCSTGCVHVVVAQKDVALPVLIGLLQGASRAVLVVRVAHRL